MLASPIVMKDFIIFILSIPLKDKSLQMDLYKVYSLPLFHTELKVKFIYLLEGKYHAMSTSGMYAAIPTSHEINICHATQVHLCVLSTALYQVDKIEWGIEGYVCFVH